MRTSPPTLRPPWCGDPSCDERTRFREVGPERTPIHCPVCSPRSPTAIWSTPAPAPEDAPALIPPNPVEVHAIMERKRAEWYRRGLAMISDLAAAQPRRISMDTLWQLGLPNPPSPAMCGQLWKLAKARGLVEPVGVVRAASPLRAGGVNLEWVTRRSS